MKVADRVIDGFLKIIMALSSLILFVVTFLQVIFRFLFKYPLPWSQDIIRICFVYLVFFGAAYCVKERAHLNVDVLLTALSPKARKGLELVINIGLLGFCIFIAYYGFQFSKTGETQYAPYLPIPMSFYYLSVPISGIFMVYYLIQQIFEQIKGFNDKDGKGGNIA